MSEEEYPYKVSVSILTYNQADYIQKAVDSAIAQEVDFPYEIIIGDDYSTDGTREILFDYKQKYPDLIKLNLQDSYDEEGIAGRKNNVTNIQSAQGKYIAFLDGDDFWISEDKLQKQADFMDGKPEVSFCCSDALVIDEVENKRYVKSDKWATMKKSCEISYEDIIKKKFSVAASSTFYQTKLISPLPEWFWNVYSADIFLQLIALDYGPGWYFKDLTIGRVLTKYSLTKLYTDRLRVKIKKNDHAIIAEHFSHQKARPYSYKAVFFMNRALRYRERKKYLKMLMSIYKVYSHDPRQLVRWFKAVVDTKKKSFTKFFKGISNF